MEHDHLMAMFNRLKLTAIRDQLDSLIDEAGRRELTIREALSLFCEREIGRKDERRIEMSVGLARFPFVRDLDGFEFAAQPSIDKKQIRELTAGRFIANAEVVLLLGPPGVGKTHLAVAIGRQAILAGYTVLFVPAPTLVAQLAKAHSEGHVRQAGGDSRPKLRRLGCGGPGWKVVCGRRSPKGSRSTAWRIVLRPQCRYQALRRRRTAARLRGLTAALRSSVGHPCRSTAQWIADAG